MCYLFYTSSLLIYCFLFLVKCKTFCIIIENNLTCNTIYNNFHKKFKVNDYMFRNMKLSKHNYNKISYRLCFIEPLLSNHVI